MWSTCSIYHIRGVSSGLLVELWFVLMQFECASKLLIWDCFVVVLVAVYCVFSCVVHYQCAWCLLALFSLVWCCVTFLQAFLLYCSCHVTFQLLTKFLRAVAIITRKRNNMLSGADEWNSDLGNLNGMLTCKRQHAISQWNALAFSSLCCRASNLIAKHVALVTIIGALRR